MSSRKRLGALLVVAVAGFLAALAGSIHSARAAGPTLTIWVDQNRKDAVTQLANQWVAKNPGVTVNVVVQDFGSIRDKLGTVDASTQILYDIVGTDVWSAPGWKRPSRTQGALRTSAAWWSICGAAMTANGQPKPNMKASRDRTTPLARSRRVARPG